MRAFFAVSLLSLAACDDAAVDSSDADAIGRGNSNPVDVCHYDEDEDAWEIISVSSNGNAVNAHLSNHDDWLVTEEICGDGIDNDCDGQIDEDCCPCTETVDVAGAAADMDDSTSTSVCYDDYYVAYNGGYSYDGYYESGYDSSSDYGATQLIAYDLTGSGYTANYGDYYCVAVDYDYDAGTYDVDDHRFMTQGEYDSCVAEIDAIIADNSCDTSY